ncbi:hypothetical protein PGB90_004114 [Kerria lacca]
MDERLLNDLLECSVCLEQLDTSSKVLPCQHTFCKKCLEEIVHTHKELRCPECRVLVDVGIDELPPNVLLMRILEGMRNAPRRTSTVVNSYQSDMTVADTTKACSTSFSSHSCVRSRSTNRQVSPNSDLHQPYAIAKCDCIAKVAGDLSFKRGDVIFLRRKIDQNWCQGECNGILGVFPFSYVQVMIPLPSHIPQCKALYDFNKCHEDDEGCLHFSKGDVITVLRRIDENWAEGKLDDKIGIFPITFVEMNYLAKNLMKLFFNSPGPSRSAPLTPTDESLPLISKDGFSVVYNTTQQNISDNLIGCLSPSSSSSSSTSTATTSPTSSSESTTPSSPINSPSVQSAQSINMKRHSFTLGAQPPPYHAPPSVHRHSAEILKHEDLATGNQEINSELEQQIIHSKQNEQSPTVQPDEILVRQNHNRKKNIQNDHLDITREQQSFGLTSKQINGNMVNFQRQSSLRMLKSSCTHSKSINHPALPAMYIAIYPYKPQKTDELELKIGSVYTVIERCQDGWFKGTSHINSKCGVFPGNYVTPMKSLPVLQAQLRGIMHNSSPKQEIRNSSENRVNVSSVKTSIVSSAAVTVSSNNGNKSRLAPPELPARCLSPVHCANNEKVSSTIWHVPVCELREKPVSSARNQSKSGKHESEENTSVNNGFQKSNDQKISKSLEKSKEKKEKGSVSLMRRLTNMKKSRSPPPTSSFLIDNPVFEDSGTSPVVQVAHARSDSCPSQFSYNTQSCTTNSASSTNNHANIIGGSQRVKHKQRSSLQNQFSRTSESNTSVISSNILKTSKDEKLVISHRKSSSLDTTVCEERQSHKTKPADPPPRERYRCIAPYPPNSEFELELKVGDVIYVHKKREDGWYKGTLQRNGRTGLFPASFVESI